MRFIFLLIALALLLHPTDAVWGEPLIMQGTCYERAIQYGTAMEQQGIAYQIGMSEVPYHVWILRDGRSIEPGYGYAPDEWYVPGVDYSTPWQTFQSVAALKFWVEGGGDAKVYWYDDLSDLRDCDTAALKRFIHCGE